METTEKFSTKLNKQVLLKLRAFAMRNNSKIAVVDSQAIAEYPNKVEVRPAFRNAAAEVIWDHRELLKELAK